MSSGKAKDFFVSGASTPLTAVAAEPLSITESVAPPPPPKTSLPKASRKKILSQSDKKSLDDIRKEEIQSTDTSAKVTGVVPNVPPPDVEPEESQEVLSRAHRPGSPAHSSKGSISSSISSSIKTQQIKSKPGKILQAEHDMRSPRHQSSSHTPSPREKRKEENSGKRYNREALLEEYNALQKERKALRKRNLQAQTNIAQYMRKHSMEILTVHDMDRSQGSLRDEYNQLLNKIESLATTREEEEDALEEYMQEIQNKKKLLQTEINRIQSEMNSMKMQIPSEPLGCIDPKVLQQKDVYDHLKKLDYAEREIMPVRLEYVKLKRQLEATEDKYLKMTRSQHEGLDQNQITIDNRVLSDKVEERTDELSKLSQMMNTDVVVLTHVNMKLTEMEEANKQLEAEVESGSEKIAKLKAEETQLKSQLSELNKEYDKLDARVGLLGHKSLLADYSKTLKHLDNVRKGVNKGSIDGGQTPNDEENSEEDEGVVRSKQEKSWGSSRHSRKKDKTGKIGCGIGSGESEISSPNERDNESSN